METMINQYCIIANKGYGLFCGVVTSIEPSDHDETMTVSVSGCRHIARWYGHRGGITSLAAHGICGPDADQSLIGAAVEATCGGVVNIFKCSDKARKSLEEHGA